ncbi:hypothetical protein E4T52_13131 [Aureobasidium sp. EXF-3400]|nr:hypothetical protein E4T51_12214 [Aureobasidium sp. EXF-12344]KAI4771873.1 hypothetical protein E4T52_13131 [Aureobasidium sp. EXF-3400]
MHIPTVQSLVCLSLLAFPYATAAPLDENLSPRAATACNANDVKTVNNSNKQPVTYCKSWLSSKNSKSAVKGLNVAQVSNACKCIQASASSSSVAAAKKMISTKKMSSSTIRTTSSARKTTSSLKTTLKQVSISTRASSSTKSSTSTKKTSTSSKQLPTSKPSTSSKTSTSQKAIVKSTGVTSKKSASTSVSTKQSSSSSISTTKISSLPTSSSFVPSSASSATTSSGSGTFSASMFPMDAVTSVTVNQKAPTGVSTRSSSSIQTSSSTVNSSSTSSPSANTKNVHAGDNIIVNGMFSQGSTTGWHGARAFGTKFGIASLAGDSNYEALVRYALAANDNASGQLYQNVTIPANSAWQLNADVYLNYPNSLPVGVSCVVKYSLGDDSMILKQYGVASASGPVLSDSASGVLSQGFTGRFMIDTYCNSASSSAASFALGFGNIQLYISDAGSASQAAVTTAATSASSPSPTTSSAATSTTSANMLTNGNFGTGDFSSWALFRLGNPTFAIQGNPGSYLAVINFPAGGDSSSQAALLQQSATAKAGKTYTASMGLVLNFSSGLANDGSTCSLQLYFVDSNGFGVSFAQTSYKYGDAAFQSISGSGSVNNGFDGNLNILIRCYGSAKAILAGVEDVQLFESS